MKVYSIQFDAARPMPARFWAPQNSIFKIGLKVYKNGEELSGVTLTAGGQALSADEDKYFGWNTWTIQSQAPGAVKYKVGASGTAQQFDLVQVNTDSSVFELDATGGSVPADVATQTYVQEYVTTETSAFVEGASHTQGLLPPTTIEAINLEDYNYLTANALTDPQTVYVVVEPGE